MFDFLIHFLITFLNKPELIFLHTIKWFHLISNNSFEFTVKRSNSSISNKSV